MNEQTPSPIVVSERYPDVEKAARDLMKACKRHGFRMLSLAVTEHIIARISYMKPGDAVSYYIDSERLRQAEKED